MSTKSFTSLRGQLNKVLQITLCSVCVGSAASAQKPSVISSGAIAVPHNEVYGAPWQSAVSNRGDFVLFDFKTSGTYQYPANGGPEITVFAPGVVAGGFTDSGIAIDPRNNNLYLNNNYNGGLLMYPFDATTGIWDLPSVVVASGLAGNLGGSCGSYFQSAGLAMNANGVLAVATENGCGVEIFTVPIDLAGNFGAATPIVANMTARAKTLAIDFAGNIYFNEDNGRAGALYIPAGTTALADDKSVVRIDPALASVQGVTVDSVGNIYIVDGAAGAYQIPLQAGVPALSSTTLLSKVPANGGPSVDSRRGILFYPIQTTGSLTDLAKIYLNRTEFGSLAAGTMTPATVPVNFFFSADANPYSFSLIQSGVAGTFSYKMADLAGCGLTYQARLKADGTPALDPYGNPIFDVTATKQLANTSCAVPVTFMPSTVGRATATLQMLDKAGNVLASALLHGVGTGATAEILPSVESPVGTGLKTPSQIATDATGNLYIADSGQTSVLIYVKGSGKATVPTTAGKFTAPTGVAVDPVGNLYVADGGSVFELPYVVTGTDSKSGQPIYGFSSAAPMTLRTGLGANVKLAADAIGDVYIADPDNQRYIQLRTVGEVVEEIDTPGFPMLSAIATDGAGDVFLASGPNLIEVSTKGQQTVAAISSSTNGLATDNSNAVYVSSSTQTVRIPMVGGTLSGTSQTVIAPAATKPTSVAVDTFGNVFVSDAAAQGVDMLSPNGLLNLGQQSTATSTSNASATIINNGNAPLSITSFGSTADYTVTSNSCTGTAVAPGAICSATVTFNPGPGDQGVLTTALVISGNQVYTPASINVTGTGFQLASSTTTVTINKPTVTSSTIVVNVAPTTGTTPVPTGNVTLTVTGGPLVKPLVFTQALINGTTTFSPTNIPAGSLTFAVKYIGDRVYGVSTASSVQAVAKGTLTLTQPVAASVPIYVLGNGQGTLEPYDGSQIPYYYRYPVTVMSANGAPIVGIPIFNSGGTQTGSDFGSVTYTVSASAQACAGTSGAVPVGADGTAPFGTDCLGIDTSNNQIPNILTSYTVTPTYSGANYASVTGTPVTFIALRNPSVMLSANPASLNVTAGSKVMTTLTVSSLLGYGVTGALSNLNNYSLPVELNCSGLPAHATCSFSYPRPDPSSPTAVAVLPGAPGTVIMTVNTNVAVGTTASLQRRPIGYRPQIFAALIGFGLFGIALGRKKTFGARLMALLPLFTLTVVVLDMVACTSANISPAPQLTTPSGNYLVTVTAKQSGSRQVPSSQIGAPPITVYGSANLMSVPFTVKVTVQ